MWDILGWIISSDPRRLVLEALEDGPLRPSTISENQDLRKEYTSRALSELSEKGLVVCLNPNAHKGRLYDLTEKGEEVLEELKEKDL